MMFSDIIVNGEFITLGNETSKKEDLYIHLGDYGDDFFDLSLCYKKTKSMFGNISWVAIPSYKISETSKELRQVTGINSIEKELITNWDF